MLSTSFVFLISLPVLTISHLWHITFYKFSGTFVLLLIFLFIFMHKALLHRGITPHHLLNYLRICWNSLCTAEPWFHQLSWCQYNLPSQYRGYLVAFHTTSGGRRDFSYLVIYLHWKDERLRLPSSTRKLGNLLLWPLKEVAVAPGSLTWYHNGLTTMLKLPTLFEKCVGIPRDNLPWRFASIICRRNFLCEFAAVIYRGNWRWNLLWLLLLVLCICKQIFFIYEQISFYIRAKHLYLWGFLLTVFLFVMVVAVMGHRSKITCRVNLVIQLSLYNVKN